MTYKWNVLKNADFLAIRNGKLIKIKKSLNHYINESTSKNQQISYSRKQYISFSFIMNNFHFVLLVVALFLLNTSLEVVAIKTEDVSIKSPKIKKKKIQSLAELRVSRNFKSSLHEVPLGTNPSQNLSPPHPRYT